MIRYLILFFVGLTSFVYAQEDKSILFGLQIKPIIPNNYFNAGSISQSFYSNDSVQYNFELKPRVSQSIGMIIRKNLSKTISYETGMNLIQRKYKLLVESNELSDYTNFSVRSYEVPIQILAFVKASQKVYLNGSFGVSYNVFSSDTYSEGETNSFFYQNTSRRRRGQSAFIANLGAEYRTKDKGYFYLGFSLHRPLKSIVRVFPEYNDGKSKFNITAPSSNSYYIEQNGNFITFDFRYFFQRSNN
ncbi:MAG: outer membrane beta-barrel protein [Flavobacteriales bacterium]